LGTGPGGKLYANAGARIGLAALYRRAGAMARSGAIPARDGLSSGLPVSGAAAHRPTGMFPFEIDFRLSGSSLRKIPAGFAEPASCTSASIRVVVQTTASPFCEAPQSREKTKKKPDIIA